MGLETFHRQHLTQHGAMNARTEDVWWTPTVNRQRIRCGCGYRFNTRVDRWWHTCPQCKSRISEAELRKYQPEEWAKEQAVDPKD